MRRSRARVEVTISGGLLLIVSSRGRRGGQVFEIVAGGSGMGTACQVFCVRSLSLALVLFFPACVDAPITEAHIAPDGQLRTGLEQSAFSSSFSAQPRPMTGQAVQVAAVLAAQAEGALEDAAEFSRDVGAVHLHLRADSLMEPRPVLFVWTHAGAREEVRGVLAPTTTLTLAASHPIAPAVAAPVVDASGQPVRGEPWQVEVYAADAAGQAGELLFRREFLVL